MGFEKIGSVWSTRGCTGTKNPGENRDEKPDAAEFAAPSGHDDPGQALGELRRMIDAARHRIRREFIRVPDYRLHGADWRFWLRRQDRKIGNSLMTDALAVVAFGRNRLVVFGHFMPVLVVAIAEHPAGMACQC
jgi:hypothetical protein